MTGHEFYKKLGFAKYLRLNKDEVFGLLCVFMRDHGLDQWQRSVEDFNVAGFRDSLAVCSNELKIIGISTQAVKTKTPAEIKDIILHEIAHALVGGKKHGKAWQKKAVELGVRERYIIGSVLDNGDRHGLASLGHRLGTTKIMV
jgi:hypothetical protein